MSDTRPWLILAGGFLGAGKTSLLVRAGTLLRQRGLRVGVVTNDQAANLVDTTTARRAGLTAEEVAGACFCCAFSDFVDACLKLADAGADVILAEPVGSCTDIVATVLRPLLDEFAHRFRIAPFTVLIDAQQHAAMIDGNADTELAWLYQQQLAEADIVVESKCDTATEFFGEEWPRVSAKTGVGVEEWLEFVMSGTVAPASHALVELDYARYARAEARMAWLNLSATLTFDEPMSVPYVVGPWFDDLDARLSSNGAQLAHMKLWVDARGAWLRLSSTRAGAEPVVEGDRMMESASELRVTLNLRAAGDARLIEQQVRASLAALDARVDVHRLDCFEPAPPRPQRMLRV